METSGFENLTSWEAIDSIGTFFDYETFEIQLIAE